jgi:hypothetical protein
MSRKKLLLSAAPPSQNKSRSPLLYQQSTRSVPLFLGAPPPSRAVAARSLAGAVPHSPSRTSAAALSRRRACRSGRRSGAFLVSSLSLILCPDKSSRLPRFRLASLSWPLTALVPRLGSVTGGCFCFWGSPGRGDEYEAGGARRPPARARHHVAV